MMSLRQFGLCTLSAGTMMCAASGAVANITTLFDVPGAGRGNDQSSTLTDTLSFEAYRAALGAKATSTSDTTVTAVLPNPVGNLIYWNKNIDVTAASLRALGFGEVSPSDLAEGPIALNSLIMDHDTITSDNDRYNPQAVAMREIGGLLGLGSATIASAPDAAATSVRTSGFELSRYDQAGNRGPNDTTNSEHEGAALEGTTQVARFSQAAAGR